MDDLRTKEAVLRTMREDTQLQSCYERFVFMSAHHITRLIHARAIPLLAIYSCDTLIKVTLILYKLP